MATDDQRGTQSATTGDRPYVGPRSYERADSDIFFGRDFDTARLLSQVVAHELVLVYGESGAGKTSLLNAGLVPLLEREGFSVLPTARVARILSEGLRPSGSNLYLFNTLLSWTAGAAGAAELAGQSLAGYLGIPVQRDVKGAMSLGRALLAGPAEASSAQPRVAIFDQFEELFAVHPDQPDHRAAFFQEIREVLDNDRLFRVVFAMREDRIAQLDPFAKSLPNGARVRFRLERLARAAAVTAITGPLAKRNTGRSFAVGVAERLVDDLLQAPALTDVGTYQTVTGDFVEPVQLQVVCETLWASLSPPPADSIITEEHLKRIGDVNDALAGFYDRAVAAAAAQARIQEAKLRRWIEGELITSAGTRGIIFRGDAEKMGIPYLAIDALVDAHLLREEWRANARWCELTHDRFIAPIRESNERWLLRRSQSEPLRRQLTAKAVAWDSAGRKPEQLLDGGELWAAESWLKASDAEDSGLDDLVIAFVQASHATREQQRQLAIAQARAEEKARAAVRLTRLALGLAVALGVAVFVSGALYMKHRQLVSAISQNKDLVKVVRQLDPAALATPALGAGFPLGIDASHFDGDIDWRAVKASGVAFGYAKATDGDDFVDPKFADNWRGMKQAGLLRGAYHFFRPVVSVESQVAKFLSTVHQEGAEDLPAAVDLDFISLPTEEWSQVATEKRVPLVLQWLESIEGVFGRRPIIISSPGFVRGMLGDASPLAAYPLWIMYSTSAPEPPAVAPWAKWTLWQFTFKGRVQGIPTPVADLSWFHGSRKDLLAFAAAKTPRPAALRPGLPAGRLKARRPEVHNASFHPPTASRGASPAPWLLFTRGTAGD